MDDKVMAIVGYASAKTPILMVWSFVNQHVFRLGRAQTVEVQLLEVVYSLELLSRLWLIVAAVEKAFPVFGPGCAREFHPFNLVAQVLGGSNVAHFPFLPVGPGAGDAVGH